MGIKMTKYYAVRDGGNSRIYRTWADCETAVKGRHGVKFKAFVTEEEALAFINADGTSDGAAELWSTRVNSDIAAGFAVAFTDGSYDSRSGRYAFAAVVVTAGGEEEISGSGVEPEFASSHNVIGEVLGALAAMEYAVGNGYPALKIYHDYEGVSKWVQGSWRAQSAVARMYVSRYKDEFRGRLRVEFFKVRGHSNNRYNDRADALARAALYAT